MEHCSFSGNDNRMAGFHGSTHRLAYAKKLQSTILSTKFRGMTINSKQTKDVRYIYDNKYCERFYIIIKIIPPFLRVLCLQDINNIEMDKLYYYYRMTKQCI